MLPCPREPHSFCYAPDCSGLPAAGEQFRFIKVCLFEPELLDRHLGISTRLASARRVSRRDRLMKMCALAEMPAGSRRHGYLRRIRPPLPAPIPRTTPAEYR